MSEINLSSVQFTNIYNVRNNIIDILDSLNYRVEDYINFSVNELNAMIQNNSLDFIVKKRNIVTNEENTEEYMKQINTVYIKFYEIGGKTSKRLTPQNIDDMIDGLIKLMNNNEIGPINLGNPNEISIKDISILVKDLTASRSEIKYLELPLDDPIVRNPDITKAKKILDWSPKINLQDGLKKTIEYYKNF